MVEQHLFAFFNLVLALSLCGVVACRLNQLPQNAPWLTQVIYALCMLAGFVSASQPWVGEWPKWGSISTTGALLVYVVFARLETSDCAS